MSKFTVGTVVKLKSGGPKMTCTGAESDYNPGQVNCQWFAGSNLKNRWFPPESLEIVDESESKKK